LCPVMRRKCRLDFSVAAPRFFGGVNARTWGSRPRLTICRPSGAWVNKCPLLGLTPQATHLSPLRGSCTPRLLRRGDRPANACHIERTQRARISLGLL